MVDFGLILEVTMIGTGLQGLSALTLLGIPFLGSEASHVLIFTAKGLGSLVLVSFFSTRLVRFLIK
jgi:hypothetical protein